MSLEKRELEEYAKQLSNLTPNLSQFAKILGLLANGEPVPVREVSKNLHLSEAKTDALLKGQGSEFDADGNLIGLGLTQVPTPHMVEIAGKRLYTWCAADTLLFPMILGVTARVKTSDPISHGRISLTVTPQTVTEIDPASAVLSWSTCGEAGDVRGSFCNFTHWFASRETARKYSSKHSGTVVLTVDQVREIFRIMLKKDQIPARPM